MRKKVVLAISQLTGGGAERVVSVWANELRARGYDAFIILSSRSEDEYYIDDNVHLNSVSDSREAYLKLSYPRRLIRMRRLLKSIRPDYIISFLPQIQIWMMLASTGLRIKRIETIRVNPWCTSMTNPLFKFLWKQCYRTSYSIIIQTLDQKPFLSKKDQEKCVLIPNPISKVYIENYKKEVSEYPTEFIAAGRITPQKNYKMMIKAFANLCSENKDLRLRIFGTGAESDVSEIRQYISDLNVQENIFLMGRTPHMEEEYKKSDIFLMTSDYEGLPNALAEAMASQLVCISTDCKTGPKDLINNGVNGFLVPVGDDAKLAETIRKVLEMSKLERSEIARLAREKIMSHCSEQNSIDTLCRLLTEEGKK